MAETPLSNTHTTDIQLRNLDLSTKIAAAGFGKELVMCLNLLKF